MAAIIVRNRVDEFVRGKVRYLPGWQSPMNLVLGGFHSGEIFLGWRPEPTSAGPGFGA
jgi:hypothetical protein